MVACLHMLDAVAFHNEPIVAGSHNFFGQQGPTGMGTKQAIMHFFYQMVSLKGIYASKQSCVVVPLISDFVTQEKLALFVGA